MNDDELKIFQKNLLKWFETEQRLLPWRIKYDPYEIWISEMMLQQTQVQTVLPYFKRWMASLPSVESVALAGEDQILKLWEGLGYYSRARNIHKSAKKILENFGGIFPSDYHHLMQLPGIGRYTAGAIASIAFNQQVPVVDGNVTRVICRIMNITEESSQAAIQHLLWETAQSWIPEHNARHFNQAMMELGAMICQPQTPLCLICPVQMFCDSFKHGEPHKLPVKKARKTLTSLTVLTGVVEFQKLFLVRKRPDTGLMGGLWEFTSLEVGINQPERMPEQISNHLEQQYGIQTTKIDPLISFKHTYTSFKVRLHSFIISCTGQGTVPQNESHVWMPFEKLAELSFPAAHKKILQHLTNLKGSS
ncbi:MAG: A/G-specific adenine glycosylase [SAR324 cluster bacterium]|nr:A/G-specific adenine glycosylase [SAR324 cluster bacterium]